MSIIMSYFFRISSNTVWLWVSGVL